ncbi:MAG: ATP-grasp domain-containing protein [Acidimicrobiales bacterium]
MSRVAIVTSKEADDPDNPCLFAALSNHGLAADLVVWDDHSIRWDDYDLVVLRSTWDYSPRRAEFLTWAREVAHLQNPFPIVEYSSDKRYLADLQDRGVSIIPSHFCALGERPEFFAGDFVVKPRVGAGSMHAVRWGESDLEAATRHVEALHGEGRDVLIQPYIHSVDTLGERALIFIDGQYSHAMTKGAMLNVAQDERDFLFRREQMSLALADPGAIDFASEVLSTTGMANLLYARVDLVATKEGWLVMELELVEPSLFLTYDEDAATRLVGAISRRVA